MSERPIAATLIDVGGTLWAERPSQVMDVDGPRIKRLYEIFPSLARPMCDELFHGIVARTSELSDSLTLDIRSVIRDVIRSLGLSLGERDVTAIREAMVTPASWGLLTGAQGLLEIVNDLNLRCIVVTNAVVRGGQDYRQDFENLGISKYIHEIVSSVDTCFRKPHPAIFEAAIALAGCHASQCVVIGNSERNDVQPAVSMGMRVIRVAIEESKPLTSAANAVVTSLAEAAAVLTTWIGDDGQG